MSDSESERPPKCSTFVGATSFSLAIGCISILILIIATGYFIRAYCRAKGTNKSPPMKFSHFLLCVGVAIFVTISSTTLLSTMIFCVERDRETLSLVSGIHAVFYVLCGIMVLSIFAVRLHTVFAGTAFEFPKSVFIKLYACITTLFILGTIASTLVAIRFTTVGFFIFIFALLLYLITSFVVLYLFTYGLFKITVMMHTSRRNIAIGSCNDINHPHNAGNVNNANNISGGSDPIGSLSDIHSTDDIQVNMNEKQNYMIDVISKYSILVLFSLISSIVLGLVICIRAYVLFKEWDNWNYIMFYSYFNLAMIDAPINLFCLFGQSKFFGDKNYHRYCSCVHTWFKNMVSAWATQKLKQKQLELRIASNVTVPSAGSR